ncbi:MULTISPECIES: DedA family protein [unclassified Mumia]|uniref:DedA family protein n=1 Tax=unclassified Mumia TaxID=2621872 RepID=UPI0027E38BF5|nr:MULTISPECIES: DedA family protein [unclassified Mumia]
MSDIGGIAGFAADLMEWLGAPGAGLAVALENIFPPIPSEVILPLAGFTASVGDMNLAAALICTTLGSIVGALALYGIGQAFGRDRLYAVVARIPLVKVTDVEKTEAWFAKHGTKAVFFGRFIPIFRSLISIPAGLERMPLRIFLTLTALGSAIWNTLFIMLGYGLGSRWETVSDVVGTYSKVVLVAAVLVVVVFVVVRVVQLRRRQRAGLSEEP